MVAKNSTEKNFFIEKVTQLVLEGVKMHKVFGYWPDDATVNQILRKLNCIWNRLKYEYFYIKKLLSSNELNYNALD